MQQTELLIYETFSGIQGESTHAGRPCFFIRLTGCNLRCSYCDTKKAQEIGTGTRRTIDSLLKEAEESGIRLVEITGGEPMLQPRTPELCRRLLNAGFEVLMETNGSIDLSSLPEGVKRIIDWKTPSSGESAKMLEENYQQILVMYNPVVYETADVIQTYVYREGILSGDMGYSIAVGMFTSIISLILVLSTNKLSSKLLEEPIL